MAARAAHSLLIGLGKYCNYFLTTSSQLGIGRQVGTINQERETTLSKRIFLLKQFGQRYFNSQPTSPSLSSLLFWIEKEGKSDIGSCLPFCREFEAFSEVAQWLSSLICHKSCRF
ncbi:hypothetical protein Pfo_010491, partial [Paulownia fortunei]